MGLRIVSLFVTRGGIVGLNFASLLIVAALLHPAQFGAFVFLWSSAQLVSATAGLGSVNYLMREGSAHRGDPTKGVTKNEALWIAFGYPALFLLFIMGLGYGATTLLSETLHLSGSAPLDLLAICAASGGMIALSHSATPLRLDDKQTASMFVRDGGPSALMLIAFLVSYISGASTPRTILLFFATIAGTTALILLSYTSFSKTSLWVEEPSKTRAQQVRELRTFWGNDIIGMSLAQFDILIGAAFVNNVDLGHYQVLKRLANFVGLPLVVTNWSATVTLGKLHAEEDAVGVQDVCTQASVWSFLPGLVLLLALTAMLHLLLPLYKMELSTTNLAAFLLIGSANLVNLAFGVAIMLAVMSGSETTAFKGRLIGCIIGGAMIPMAASITPMVGLAASLLVATLVLNGFIARRNFIVSGTRTDILFALRRPSKESF